MKAQPSPAVVIVVVVVGRLTLAVWELTVRQIQEVTHVSRLLSRPA